MAPPPFGPWERLHPDLVLSIAGFSLSLESYCRARGVCTAWRSALPPPSPLLLTVSVIPLPHEAHHAGRPRHLQDHPYPYAQHVSAVSLPAERSFQLTSLPRDSRCVGASYGWLAVDYRRWHGGIYLANPHSGAKVQLLGLWSDDDDKPVAKIVSAPNPRPDDYAAVAICDRQRLACTTSRDMSWMVLDVAIGRDDKLTDLAYDAGGGKVCCLTVHGDVHVLRIPRGEALTPTVEPLHADLPFDPAAIFAPPYDTASKFIAAKSLFLCGGSLYQVWRNTACGVSCATPGGGRFRMSMGDVFVLKHDQGRRPCWNAVKDLGGYSVFVGRNNAVALRPEGTPGVRANCVYWIAERSRNELMVFDMAAGTSTLHPFAGDVQCPARGTNFWYFLNDNSTSIDDDGAKKAQG